MEGWQGNDRASGDHSVLAGERGEEGIEREGRAAEGRGGLSRSNWKVLIQLQRIGGRERGKEGSEVWA